MASPDIIALVVIAVLVLLSFLGKLCHKDCKEEEAHDDQEPGGGAAAGEEMEQQLPASPSLVCTYLRADGWREGSCGVCLAELEDGEAVRVLPACMHYFHAECVGEWLMAHATCPLCRATLTAAA